MKIENTPISGLRLLTPNRFADLRGYFSECWNKAAFESHRINADFVQDNQSLSIRPGTVRGLHFQSPPHAQAKLVRCGRGRLYDVAVDIRVGSPTFAKWFGVELSADNGRQLFIPAGFLHGFVTREPDTEILYKCSDYYAPDCDGAVRFDCPDIELTGGWDDLEPILSDKDAAAPCLKDFRSPFVWSGA